MLPSSDNLYFELRSRCGGIRVLNEKQDSPPERLLQAVWQHQRVLRDKLKTSTGEAVTVLHPGFWSFEGGPDFRDALIQFGAEAPVRGDVEVDLRRAGWRAHNHYRNPSFKKVILHVVWDQEQNVGEGPPLLWLKPVLDSSIGELSQWLSTQEPRNLPETSRGKCYTVLREMSPSQQSTLLLQAAEVRLAAKAAWFQARGRHAGWEQSLWEGLFRALGYKHNSWAMQRVAELRSRWAGPALEVLPLQARLLGISGMLPLEVPRPTDDGVFLRKLWDCWWRERDAFADCTLPREAWRLHGLRPANNPQRRLALAAHWVLRPGMVKALEEWCSKEVPRGELVTTLEEVLQVESDEYWSWHWSFRSARLPRAQPLLGKTRVSDLAINTVLPWLVARALEGNNTRLLGELRRRYFEWPTAEDNSVLKLARQRLFGAGNKSLLRTAAAQQGLIQIVRDYCDRSDSVCTDCQFPEVIANLCPVDKVAKSE